MNGPTNYSVFHCSLLHLLTQTQNQTATWRTPSAYSTTLNSTKAPFENPHFTKFALNCYEKTWILNLSATEPPRSHGRWYKTRYTILSLTSSKQRHFGSAPLSLVRKLPDETLLPWKLPQNLLPRGKQRGNWRRLHNQSARVNPRGRKS